MKSLSFAFAVVLVSSQSVQARAAEPGAINIAVDGAVVMPLSDWNDLASVGLGPLVRVEYQALDKLVLTGRAGYVFHFSKEVGNLDVSTSELLLLAGAKYFVVPDVFATAELGFNNWGVDVGDVSDSDLKIALGVGGGYQLGALELRAEVLTPSLGDIDEAIGIMVGAGYSFVGL